MTGGTAGPAPADDRTPVIVASGQCLERDELVTPIGLMTRASEEALSAAPRLRAHVQQVSVVGIMSATGPAPASELATRLGIAPARREVTTIGGNSPQWLVGRAAQAIAAGDLDVALIAGVETIRSQRARRRAGAPLPDDADLPPDPVVGDATPGVTAAEAAIGLLLPVHVYPLFENTLAARAGRDLDGQRRVIGRVFAPFTEVAATHPAAWFPIRRTPEEIANPSPGNRVVAEPYTKLMSAFLGSDQAAALLVCSLAAARRAGVADRAVFVWAATETTEVWAPTARPDPGRSPAIAAAGRALFDAASQTAGTAVTVDDVELVDLYSCFPSAVELAAAALGLSLDDSRHLTVTGGLPYFGGPGNNYATHGIATLTDRLRGAGRHHPTRPVLGLATGLGWFATKHALGLYGTVPPPKGFVHGDTVEDQRVIDTSAVPVVPELPRPATATVVTATVVRDREGIPTAAPLIARLADGAQMAASPADDVTLTEMGARDVPSLVGSPVRIEAGPARYRLVDH